MKTITGELFGSDTAYSAFAAKSGEIVSVSGYVHRIREMTGFAFIILRTARELIQCVYAPEFSDYRLDGKLCEEACVKITGKVVASKDRDGNDRYELQIHDIKILSLPAETLPIVINKKQLDGIQLSTVLDLRPVSMRNPKERAIFKLQEGIARGFREFLMQNGFTEIRSPKINFAGAEGGTNVFKLDYFGKEVYLAQSPQLYKQALVGVFNRVFEIAPVFRA
ncbi:MAG: aspartate--tRNA(Asn) ligase, partial [Clostridia bacterium]|nr:aspartate--tRNA(Asn) ligase [Clostridia bacterium]